MGVANRVGRRPERFATPNNSLPASASPHFEPCPLSGLPAALNRVVSILSTLDFLITDLGLTRLTSSWWRLRASGGLSRCYGWFWKTASACPAWWIPLRGFPFAWDAMGGPSPALSSSVLHACKQPSGSLPPLYLIETDCRFRSGRFSDREEGFGQPTGGVPCIRTSLEHGWITRRYWGLRSPPERSRGFLAMVTGQFEPQRWPSIDHRPAERRARPLARHRSVATHRRPAPQTGSNHLKNTRSTRSVSQSDRKVHPRLTGRFPRPLLLTLDCGTGWCLKWHLSLVFAVANFSNSGSIRYHAAPMTACLFSVGQTIRMTHDHMSRR